MKFSSSPEEFFVVQNLFTIKPASPPQANWVFSEFLQNSGVFVPLLLGPKGLGI
jgi:hypothetical protein